MILVLLCATFVTSWSIPLSTTRNKISFLEKSINRNYTWFRASCTLYTSANCIFPVCKKMMYILLISPTSSSYDYVTYLQNNNTPFRFLSKNPSCIPFSQTMQVFLQMSYFSVVNYCVLYSFQCPYLLRYHIYTCCNLWPNRLRSHGHVLFLNKAK